MAAFRASSGPNTATLAPSCTRMAGGERFKGPGWVWPARADRWHKPVIVAVSLLGHAAIFSYLGLRSMGLTIPDLLESDPVIYVQMEPRPLLAGEVARVRPPPERAQDIAAPALPNSATAARDLPFRDPTEDDDIPAPPAPRLGTVAPGAPAPPPGVEGWSVRPETLGDRVGRGLRTRGPGCNSPALLSAAERAICDDRFGQRAGAAPPVAGTGNPERDARFAREGAQRLADYDRRRLPLSGRPGVILSDDCGGSNQSNLGLGCAGAHLDPEFRQDREAALNQGLGTDRSNPTAPRLPRAGQTDD